MKLKAAPWAWCGMKQLTLNHAEYEKEGKHGFCSHLCSGYDNYNLVYIPDPLNIKRLSSKTVFRKGETSGDLNVWNMISKGVFLEEVYKKKLKDSAFKDFLTQKGERHIDILTRDPDFSSCEMIGWI